MASVRLLSPFSARRGGVCWVDESGVCVQVSSKERCDDAIACKYCRGLGAAVAVLIGEL